MLADTSAIHCSSHANELSHTLLLQVIWLGRSLFVRSACNTLLQASSIISSSNLIHDTIINDVVAAAADAAAHRYCSPSSSLAAASSLTALIQRAYSIASICMQLLRQRVKWAKR